MMKDHKVICDECQNEFQLSSIKIQTKEIELKNEKLTLDFFTCPKCNKIYRVCLKDALYEELKEDLEKTKKRIRRNSGSNKVEMASMLNTMVLRKQERLSKHIDRLNDIFPGTFTLSASENNGQEEKLIYLP